MNKFMKNILEPSHKLMPRHHWAQFAIGGAMAAGGALATWQGTQEMEAARRHLQENKALWEALQTPNIENLKVKLEQAVSQGKLDPKLGQALLANPSMMRDVGANPKLVQAQEQTLQRYQEISQARGQDATTRARMAETMGQVGQQERAGREALQAQMQRRGMGGSGADLAQQALLQQRGADRTAQMDSVLQQMQSRELYKHYLKADN